MDFQPELDEHQTVAEGLRDIALTVEGIADQMTASVRSGGTIFWFGNGGSASQADHLAAELVGRYEQERAGLPSVALATTGAVVTSIANDYSFDDVFARQIQALCRRGDIAVGLSTSGNSTNVLRGIQAARDVGAWTVGMTGRDGGKLARLADAAILVPSTRTSRIQEAHLFLGHLLCGHIESHASSGDG